MKKGSKIKVGIQTLWYTIEGLFKEHWWKFLLLIVLGLVIATTFKTCIQKSPSTLDNSTQIDSLKALVNSQSYDLNKLRGYIQEQKKTLYIKDFEINRIVNNNVKTINEYYKQSQDTIKVDSNVISDSIRSILTRSN